MHQVTLQCIRKATCWIQSHPGLESWSRRLFWRMISWSTWRPVRSSPSWTACIPPHWHRAAASSRRAMKALRSTFWKVRSICFRSTVFTLWADKTILRELEVCCVFMLTVKWTCCLFIMCLWQRSFVQETLHMMSAIISRLCTGVVQTRTKTYNSVIIYSKPIFCLLFGAQRRIKIFQFLFFINLFKSLGKVFECFWKTSLMLTKAAFI